MLDLARQVLHGPRVGLVLVRPNGRPGGPGQRHLEHLPDGMFDGSWVGPAQLSLEFLPALLLPLRHAARPPQRRVGEVQDEAGVVLDGDEVLEGEELAEFEGFQAIGDDVAWR